MTARRRASRPPLTTPLAKPLATARRTLDAGATGLLVLACLAGALPVSAQQSFDLVISLEASPIGDADAMARYEEIVQDFSDAVYEATEGAHTIGEVTFYTSSLAHDRADVIWQQAGHPKSALNGLRGPGHLYMVDVFSGGGLGGADLALTDAPELPDAGEVGPRAAGAVLAHEWSHYAYGVLDEHVVSPGDVPVLFSLMSDPLQFPNDARWASFSVAAAGATPGAFEDTGLTAHHRRYGRSGWELLTLDPQTDLVELLTAPLPGFPERTGFADLVAPASLPVVDGPGPTIPTPRWVSPCSRYVIAIDNSGSMTGTPLSRAKTLANNIVDFMASETTWVSVLSFGSDAVVRTAGPVRVSDQEDLGGETERDGLHDAIAQIAAIPVATLFSSGLEEARNQLQLAAPLLDAALGPECDPDPRAAAVFFLSDASNSPGDTDLDAAILALAQDGIPVYPLDVSDFDPDVTSNEMTPLAAGTGGILMVATAGSTQALQAWAQAEFETRSRFPLHEEATLSFVIPESGAAGSVQIPVAMDLDRIAICASTDIPVDRLVLTSPSGVEFPAVTVRDTEAVPGDDCSTFWAVDNPPEVGSWELTGEESLDVVGDATVTLEATGYTAGAAFALQAWVGNASAVGIPEGDPIPVRAPEPILVTASFGRELPIVGARLFATLGPGGAPASLRDDGVPPDAISGDGLYTGAIPFDGAAGGLQDVFVTATNELGLATLSSRGLVLAPSISGGPIPPEEDVDINGPLLRFATIEDIETFDAVPPGTLDDELDLVGGRIASSGEVDSFVVDLAAIGVSSGASDLEIRVTGALLGMSPRLTVLQGTTVLGEATANPGESGVVVPVQSSDGLVDVEVRHATGGTGTYLVSAGPRLGLDFGPAGLSDSPCDLALGGKNAALAALELGLEGVPSAIVLLEESRELERLMMDGIRVGLGNGQTGKAGRYLKRAFKRDGKALSRLERAERQRRSKELKGARRKIRNARSKLTKACSRLADGGSILVPMNP
jgi:hypothetical protein